MKQQTQQYLQEIDQSTQTYLNTFQSLDPETLNWQPQADKWSIAQCIDHIITTNEQYFSIFEKSLEPTYKSSWVAKIPGMTKWMGNMIFNSVKPTNEKKVKTFPVFEPTQSNIDASILNQLEANHQELKTWIEKLDRLDISKVVISSPVNQYIVYTLQKAIEIVIAHEKRHFNQAKGVLDLYQKNH